MCLNNNKGDKTMEFGNTQHNEMAICPWCYKAKLRVDDIPFIDDEYTCEHCGKSFEVISNVEITYSTFKIK